jgi:hypothetical protein
VKDVWLESAEGISVGQGMQGVVLLPSSVIVQFLEVGQIFGQVFNPIMYASEALYFSVQGFILFLSDGKVNHWGKCLPGEEGIGLLACKDSVRVWILSHSKWT